MADRELVTLPNKDLWRGYVYEEAITPAEVAQAIAEEKTNPVNKTMAEMHAAAKGASVLTCTRCGLQGNDVWMRNHLTTRHRMAMNPVPVAEIAVAQAIQAQAELNEAKKEAE